MEITEEDSGKVTCAGLCDRFHTMKQSLLSPKLAVFDLDGTLVELEIEHFIDHAIQLTARLGFEAPTREHTRYLMHNHRVHELFPPEDRERAIHEYWHSYDARQIPAPRLIDGALATLEEMVAQGCDLAIATARTIHQEELREVLRPTGILKHVEFLSTWWQTGWSEKTDQLRIVCRGHKVEPSSAIMVGDSIDDIRSAKAAGFGLSIGLTNGMHSPDVLRVAEPHYLLDDIIHVPPVVSNHFKTGQGAG